jgi:O-antigen ligase
MIRQWLSLAIRIAAIAVLGAIQVAWMLQPVPISLKLLPLALLALSCAHPESGLVALAGLGLLSTPLSEFLQSPLPGGKLLEQLVLAVIIGGLVRSRRFQGPTRLGPTMMLYGTIAAASAATLLPTRLAVEMPGASLIEILRALWRSEFFSAKSLWLPLYLAMLAVESASLAWTVERIARRTPQIVDRVLDTCLVSGAVLSLLALHTVYRAAWRTGPSWSRLFDTFLMLRVNAQTDVNAGASLLLLVLLAGASRLRGSWEHDRLRAGLMGLVIIGLWNTGSRMALLSLAVTLVVVGLVALMKRSSRARPMLVGGLAAGVVIAALLVAYYPARRNSPLDGTIETRLGLAGAALTMAKEAPILGVGIGRFYELSGQYAPRVFYLMNNGKTRENAHNNFLQVLAEQGAAGLIVLLLALGNVLLAPARLEQPGDRRRRFWFIVAFSACLLTWLSGHPLLVGEFAFVFWIYAALLASLAAPPRAGWRWVAGAAAVAIVVSGVLRSEQQLRAAPLEHIGAGLSQWEHDLGIPYRRAGSRFSLYLPAADAYVTLPIQRITRTPDALILQVWRDGRQVDAEWIVQDGWQNLRFRVPRAKRDFVLFDFVAVGPDGSSPDGDLLRVGKAQVH